MTPTADGSARRHWSAVLSGPLLVADEGTLPSWAFGLGFGVGIRVRRFEAVLNAILWLRQPGAPADLSPYGAQYERRTGQLSTCYGWPLHSIELGPCLVLAVEDVTATATGGSDLVGGPGNIPWMTVGVAARARWSPSDWLALSARPSVGFNTSRPIYVIDQVGTLYRTAPATVGFDLGCEWIF